MYSEVKRLKFQKLGLKALALMLRKIGNKTNKNSNRLERT
jgi:hypothetical protein